jgi:hypothetical protein
VDTLAPAELELPEIPPEDAGAPPPVDEGGADGGEESDAGADASVEGDGGVSEVEAGAEEDAGVEELPPPDPGKPAISMKYEWSNVRVVMTPRVIGEAFDADLTVTLDGCTAKYRVNAVAYQKVFTTGRSCASAIDEEGTLAANDALCSAKPDPKNGVPVGSGINPVFPVRCHPDLQICMLQDGTSVADYR